MSINLKSILDDVTGWVNLGGKATEQASEGIEDALPIINTAIGAIGELVGIGKDILTKPDPTPEHIAAVDRLRNELVAKANELR